MLIKLYYTETSVCVYTGKTAKLGNRLLTHCQKMNLPFFSFSGVLCSTSEMRRNAGYSKKQHGGQ